MSECAIVDSNVAPYDSVVRLCATVPVSDVEELVKNYIPVFGGHLQDREGSFVGGRCVAILYMEDQFDY